MFNLNVNYKYTEISSNHYSMYIFDLYLIENIHNLVKVNIMHFGMNRFLISNSHLECELFHFNYF